MTDVTPPLARSVQRTGLARLTGSRLDNHLLESAALAHRLDCLRVGPLTFTAVYAHGEVGFHGTASLTTSKIGREIAADAQHTRSALTVAGVSVPAGRAFEPGQLDQARRYADSLGYPVVVKPVGGRGGAGVATGLGDGSAVTMAVIELTRTTSAERRFVVERHIDGPTLRVYVAAGRVLWALRATDGLEITADLDPEVATLAVRAADAVLGLGHACVDVVAGDPPVVVDIDATPPLVRAAHGGAPGSDLIRGRDLARTLVRAQLGGTSEPLPGDLPVRLEVFLGGVREAGVLRRKLGRLARELAVTADVSDDTGGIRAAIVGPLDRAAAIPSLLSIGRVTPELIETAAPEPVATAEGAA